MPKPALEPLKAWAEQPKKGKVQFVFPGLRKKNAPLDMRGSWLTAVALAGLEDFHFHDLRHTTASYLAMSGASWAEIAEILGHKTLSMVKRYAHLTRTVWKTESWCLG